MTLGKTWNLALPRSSRLGDGGSDGPHVGAVVRGNTSGHSKRLRLCQAHWQNTGRVSHHQRAPGTKAPFSAQLARGPWAGYLTRDCVPPPLSGHSGGTASCSELGDQHGGNRSQDERNDHHVLALQGSAAQQGQQGPLVQQPRGQYGGVTNLPGSSEGEACAKAWRGKDGAQ